MRAPEGSAGMWASGARARAGGRLRRLVATLGAVIAAGMAAATSGVFAQEPTPSVPSEGGEPRLEVTGFRLAAAETCAPEDHRYAFEVDVVNAGTAALDGGRTGVVTVIGRYRTDRGEGQWLTGSIVTREVGVGESLTARLGFSYQPPDAFSRGVFQADPPYVFEAGAVTNKAPPGGGPTPPAFTPSQSESPSINRTPAGRSPRPDRNRSRSRSPPMRARRRGPAPRCTKGKAHASAAT